MKRSALWLSWVIFALLSGCATDPGGPGIPGQGGAANPQIWGPFFGLAGTTWTAPNEKPIRYRWLQQGQILSEEQFDPVTDQAVAINIIMPDPMGSGGLSVASGPAIWSGRADGTSSASFSDLTGVSKETFRVQRTLDGALVREHAPVAGAAGAGAPVVYRLAGAPAPSTASTDTATAPAEQPQALREEPEPSRTPAPQAEEEEYVAYEEEDEPAPSNNTGMLFGAVMAGLSQGLAEGAADYQMAQQGQAALLNSLTQAARVAQMSQQAAEAEEETVEEPEPVVADTASTDATEAEQDAVVMAAMAQTRQLMADGGGGAEMLAQIDETQRILAERNAPKQKAGTHKLVASKMELSTATNTVTSTPNQPEPIAGADNKARGKVRLCNRPGDEGPAHWPLCPRSVEDEEDASRLRAGADGAGVGASGTSSPGENISGPGNGTGGGGSGGQGNGQPGNGSPTNPGQAQIGDGETKAWCTQRKPGKFQCWGANGKSSLFASLQTAKEIAGCSKGEGRPPALGESILYHCKTKMPPWKVNVPDSYPDW